MSETHQPTQNAPASARWRAAGLFAVRYGLGGAMILAGIVVLFTAGGDAGTYGFASAVGAGLSVMLLNLLYRMSVSGDRDREREERARRYFDTYGTWPEDEEAPVRSPGHRSTLPVGVVTPEQEERQGRFGTGARAPTTASRS